MRYVWFAGLYLGGVAAISAMALSLRMTLHAVLPG